MIEKGFKLKDVTDPVRDRSLFIAWVEDIFLEREDHLIFWITEEGISHNSRRAQKGGTLNVNCPYKFDGRLFGVLILEHQK